ncbi:MAG: universal stress protein [Candidatus Competibacteraceae bacterium]|nr:universal stress protein [Candidatus Competibacteraceae bacterium]
MYQHILVPVDLSHRSSWEKSLPTALNHIRQLGGRLTVMTVVPEIDIGMTAVHFPKDYSKRVREEARQRLEAFVREQVPDEIGAEAVVGHGVIYKTILTQAEELGVDLIIMASHRPELRDYLLGPNAARVVRHADCSVLVVREEANGG